MNIKHEIYWYTYFSYGALDKQLNIKFSSEAFEFGSACTYTGRKNYTRI